MSRITGTDAYDLMEAYNAVYAPQELTEEQVWEEVENWVNSLLEEGYDLSDYTWEEMYEAYLSEMGRTKTTGQATASTISWKPTPGAGSAGGSGSGGRRGSGSSPGGMRPAASPASAAPVVAAPAAPVTTSRAAAPTPSARPASAPAPSARPSAAPTAKVAPTKPAAPAKPAIGMLGKTSFERRTPTSAELKAAQAARAGGEKSPEKILQAAKSASGALSQATAAASKPAAFSPSSVATAKTSPAPKLTPRQQRLNMEMEYDAYDLVLEYLLSQGHVETVEEAHYVMLEMDAETIGTIVEAKYGTEEGRKKLAKKIRKGEEVGKSGPGTGFAAVEKAAEKGGARDPKAVAAAAMWKTYGGKK